MSHLCSHHFYIRKFLTFSQEFVRTCKFELQGSHPKIRFRSQITIIWKHLEAAGLTTKSAETGCFPPPSVRTNTMPRSASLCKSARATRRDLTILLLRTVDGGSKSSDRQSCKCIWHRQKNNAQDPPGVPESFGWTRWRGASPPPKGLKREMPQAHGLPLRDWRLTDISCRVSTSSPYQTRTIKRFPSRRKLPTTSFSGHWLAKSRKNDTMNMTQPSGENEVLSPKMSDESCRKMVSEGEYRPFTLLGIHRQKVVISSQRW